jgi:hypothetical protein
MGSGPVIMLSRGGQAGICILSIRICRWEHRRARCGASRPGALA